MLTRRRFGTGALAALAGAAAGGVGGCAGPVHILRYRMRLDVDTPEGLKSGASVIEQQAADGPRSLAGIGAGIGIVFAQRGEAVAVDLGQRGMLFCLLARDGQRKASKQEGDLIFAAFPGPSRPYIDIMKQLAATKPKADLPPDILPMLVRFRDINDPKTVERVDPNNLAAAFGQGVRLARASIEITNDPVTTGIEKKLPWLRAVGKERGTLIPNPPRLLKDTTPIQLVSPGDFSSIPAEKAK